MKKGMGPFTILVVGIVFSLITFGIYSVSFFERNNVSKRAMIEINVIDAINKVELKKIGLSKALKYSFYQISYILSKYGGYSDLSGESSDVNSYDCIPYWREYPIQHYPGFSIIEDITVVFLNEYSDYLKGEPTSPEYDTVIVRKDDNDKTEVTAFGEEYVVVERDMVNVDTISFLNETSDNNIAKMYSEAEKIFIINDGVRNAIQDAVDDMVNVRNSSGQITNCKEIKVNNICENTIDEDKILTNNCPDWEGALYNKIENSIEKLNSNFEDIEIKLMDIRIGGIFYEAECHGEGGNEDSSCGCEETEIRPCNGRVENVCTFGSDCRVCSDLLGVYIGCCGPNQICDLNQGVCVGTDGFEFCKKHKEKFDEITCNYDYYASAQIHVEVIDNSGKKYPVYDDESKFETMKLKFRILSGNIYEEIDGLANPSFEEGFSDLGNSKHQPNGWSLSWSSSPECLHKCSKDLPKIEQIGQPNALILDGDCDYKIFQGFEPFTGSLTQILNGLEPGSNIVLIAPVQVHTHGGAGIKESKVVLKLNNNQEEIKTRDREWVYGSVQTKVPENGIVELTIQLESSSKGGIDFFLDNLKIYKIDDAGVFEPETNECPGEIIEIPDSTTTTTISKPKGRIEDYISHESGGQSPLIGLSECISSASYKSGIPILVFYAIPINEGGWKGTPLQKGECLVSLGNPSGKQSNNLYSIKGSGCSWGTWECYNERLIDNCIAPNEDGYREDCGGLYYCAITDDFKSYSTKCDSVNDFANKVTTSSRYRDCSKDDAKQFVQCLKDGGYATDPSWPTKVGKIIDKLQPYTD